MNARRRNEYEQRFDFALGQAIARARKRLGMSGIQLAGCLKISRANLYRIEAGDKCSIFLVVEIAKTLGINLAELMPDDRLVSSPFSSDEKSIKIMARRGDCALG